MAPEHPAGQRSIGGIWRGIRARLIGGLLLVMPILITFWVIHWLYSSLELRVIDPLALLVLRRVRGNDPEMELPYWFEVYAAPVIAILIALALLYGLGFLVQSRLRRAIEWLLRRLPVVSVIYNGVQQVFATLERRREQTGGPQRVVLVAFPHPGMRVPAFVTASCKDKATQRTLVCVYVPTTPVPTSGFFLLVPEEEVTDLNWTAEQTLQTIISGGLTVPSEVHYFGPPPTASEDLVAGRTTSTEHDS